MKNSQIRSYKTLTDEEVLKYKEMLKKPNIEFPHYKHLVVDNKIVYQYIGENLTNEEFKVNKYFMNNYNIKVEISNFGRIKINNKNIVPSVGDNIFKHGLNVYINNDWNNKSIHRLVKETFDPIIDMEKYEVHHLNNNGNDNRLENLIWVSIEDHRRIDSEFNIELKKIGEIIRTNELNNSPNVI
jgi:hypothetical protein